MSKSLEYLDLELKHVKSKLTLDNYSYYCFAVEQGFEHRFHTKDPQLNLLCDNSYSILNNLSLSKEFNTSAFDKLSNLLIKVLKKISDLEEKLEYIKQQKSLRVSKDPNNHQESTLQGVDLFNNLDNKIQKVDTKVSNLFELVNRLL